MNLQGVVSNGTIVLNNGVHLPDGTQVEIIVRQDAAGSSLASLLQFAGAVKDLPPDMARNHDHYLHGAPKQ